MVGKEFPRVVNAIFDQSKGLNLQISSNQGGSSMLCSGNVFMLQWNQLQYLPVYKLLNRFRSGTVSKLGHWILLKPCIASLSLLQAPVVTDKRASDTYDQLKLEISWLIDFKAEALCTVLTHVLLYSNYSCLAAVNLGPLQYTRRSKWELKKF